MNATLKNRLLFSKGFTVVPVVDAVDSVWRLHYVTSHGFPRWLKKGEKLEFAVKQIEPGQYEVAFQLRRDLSREVFYTNALAEGIITTDAKNGEAIFQGNAKFSPFYMGSILLLSLITLIMVAATNLHPIFGLFSVVMVFAIFIHWISIFGDRHHLMMIVYHALTDDSALFDEQIIETISVA